MKFLDFLDELKLRSIDIHAECRIDKEMILRSPEYEKHMDHRLKLSLAEYLDHNDITTIEKINDYGEIFLRKRMNVVIMNEKIYRRLLRLLEKLGDVDIDV